MSLILDETNFYKFSMILPSLRKYITEMLVVDFLSWIEDERFEELIKLMLTNKKSAKPFISDLLKEYLSRRKEKEKKEKERGVNRPQSLSPSKLSKVEEFL